MKKDGNTTVKTGERTKMLPTLRKRILCLARVGKQNIELVFISLFHFSRFDLSEIHFPRSGRGTMSASVEQVDYVAQGRISIRASTIFCVLIILLFLWQCRPI